MAQRREMLYRQGLEIDSPERSSSKFCMPMQNRNSRRQNRQEHRDKLFLEQLDNCKEIKKALRESY